MSTKPPVTVLHEMLRRRGVLPRFELIQVEEPLHDPTFKYKVSVGETQAVGSGRTKKEAKHAAANAIIEKLPFNKEDENQNNEINISDLITKCKTIFNNEVGRTNPIGVLQEFCMSRKFPPPLYITECEGPPHDRNYTVTCVLCNRKETGIGKSKKKAKRIAAHNMWQYVLNLSMSDCEEILTCWIEEETVKLLMGMNFNFVQTLQEIAVEQQFEVTYIDIEEKSKTGEYQCLAQLSTMPVGVCMGAGTTSKTAQNVAALNALQYLQFLIKE